MKRAQYLALGLLLCAIHAWGQQVTLRTITFNIEPKEAGRIRVQPEGGVETSIVTNGQTVSYPDGTRLTLTAEPNSGFRFEYWEPIGSKLNPIQVTLDGDRIDLVSFIKVNPPESVSISWAIDRVRIIWLDGTLLSASDIMGPWTEVAGAASPYDFKPGNPRFFRARNEGGYSPNVVGHLTLPIHEGYSVLLPFFTNLATGKGNDIPFYLTPLNGDVGYLWTGNKYVSNSYATDVGWNRDTIEIPFGHAFVFKTSQARTWSVAGEVPQGNLDITVPAGSRQLLGSPVPQAGRVTTDLQYPAEAGDRIYTIDEAWNYNSYYYTEFGWMPSEPRMEVGQAFWLCHPAPTELHWKRTFYVTP